MLDEAIALLLNSQNPDGGWGSMKGKRSNTEATSLALLALESLGQRIAGAKIQGARDWLTQRQNADGSWPMSDASKIPSWSTSFAMLALSSSPDQRDRTKRAAMWALGQKGSKPGILANLVLAFSGKKKPVNLNQNLVGWPWLAGTFSWVEPTSYYLIALKKFRPHLAGTDVEERIHQGELMIYDRMCEGGGWNHGNSIVYGDSLWPYPDVTAVALLALQDRRDSEANRKSQQALAGMMKDVQSGLALSWSLICFSIYGQNMAEWRERLAQSFDRTRFLGETKTVALAILASGDGARFFRL